MKHIKLIRFTYLFIILIFLGQKLYFFAGSVGQQVILNSLNAFGDKALAVDHHTNFLIQKIVNYLVYIGVIIYAYKSLFPQLTIQKKWSLAFPTTMVISIIIGVIMAYIGRAINPALFLSPFSGKVAASSISMFEHLIISNVLGTMHAFGIATVLLSVEDFIRQQKNQTTRINWSFWLSLGLIYFVLSLVLATRAFGGLSGLLLTFTPTAALIAVLMTFSSYVFTSTFLIESKVHLRSLGAKATHFLLPSIGLVGIVVFKYSHSIGFGDLWLLSGWRIAINSFLFLSPIPAFVSFLAFRFNLSNVKSDQGLRKGLEVKKTELSLLKSQINPHFLFNSLNTVYGLALEEQSPKAAEGIQKLSDMMRFMLQENTVEHIPLEREIKYINDYIDFQTLRIADRENIQLEINISDRCKGEIAPMLLIPMIENAFKHGISLEKYSWINLALKCQNDEVHLNIKNSMHQKIGGNSEESGIGLENVRQRLKILYPNKHLFLLIESEEQFEAIIKITLS
ncbi:sensor histidine kinase [Roseivirga sp. E12]|uniref:sensor histidine kinase n=1 Tax=Roseivirga sp. E12 TaxID=2819237 RepID=UPI001ABCD769|nr:histidine kinase [Roseivirga sp. E12]MBO3698791.1 histidine kinase [Roseivirga sp. E12]